MVFIQKTVMKLIFIIISILNTNSIRMPSTQASAMETVTFSQDSPINESMQENSSTKKQKQNKTPYKALNIDLIGSKIYNL